MAYPHFGTDGWRAIIDKDFTTENLCKVIKAASRVFKEEQQACGGTETAPLLYMGYDCRNKAGEFAEIAATAASYAGCRIILSDSYCPTPTLCFSVAHDEEAIGGIMLTASHNPAEYLGVKLRMRDGGASPVSFTNRVESEMRKMDELAANLDLSTVPACLLDLAGLGGKVQPPVQNMQDGQEEKDGSSAEGQVQGIKAGELVDEEVLHALGIYQNPAPVEKRDIVTPYLQALKARVNAQAIRDAHLKVVLDPLYGAARGYLASILREFGAEVIEIHGQTDPTFGGLHPEPIAPYVNEALDAVVRENASAGFINDGDADRIAAVDEFGNYVNPHRILCLMVYHLVEDLHERGRVVSTLTASSLLSRVAKSLDLDLTLTPVGFKYIYEEMHKGDVMIGGEESGGIGIPGHVFERDGLLMALHLCEMMAMRGRTLGQLLEDMFAQVGRMEFTRVGVRLSEEAMQRAVNEVFPYYQPEEVAGRKVLEVVREDGIKILLEGDAWLMLRASGTEPLVRIYAEAESEEAVEALVQAGKSAVGA